MDVNIKIEAGEDIRKAQMILEKVISSEIEYRLDGWVTIHIVVK